MNISMKLVYQYMAIFFTFSPTSNHLHSLQVENCDGNSRLVVDEDDNGKVILEKRLYKPERLNSINHTRLLWLFPLHLNTHGSTPIINTFLLFQCVESTIDVIFIDVRF